MMFLFVWGALLIYLKLSKTDLGCASGGGVIDIAELRKIPRDQRPLSKTMAHRAWRLQAVFLLCGLGIPVATMMFLKNGLFQMIDSLQETAETVADVETLTYEGIRIVDTLTNIRNELVEADLSSKLDVKGYCPKLSNSTLLSDLNLERSTEDIDEFLSDMDTFIDGHAINAKDGFHKVLRSTEEFERLMAVVYNMDWMPKMFIVILNVLNGFMMSAAFLSKQNIAFFPFHCMLSYLIVPAFSVVLVLAVASSSAFGVASVMNADFCHGGEETILEIFDHRGIDHQDMLYQTFMYYVDECSTVNPLSVFAPDEQEFLKIFDTVSSVLSLSESYNTTRLSNECGADVAPVIAAVDILADNLGKLSSSVRRVEALTSCFKVRPILDKLFYGSMCTGSVEGLTWMFAALFAIAVLSLIMLSTRASLYNAVVKAPKKEESEREWWEYLEFMAQFYDDTDDWKYQPSPKNKRSGYGDLEQVGSFGTDLTSTDTFEENTGRDDDDSEKISLFIEDNIPVPDRYTPMTHDVQVLKPEVPSSTKKERRRSSKRSRESETKTPDKRHENRVVGEIQFAETTTPDKRHEIRVVEEIQFAETTKDIAQDVLDEELSPKMTLEVLSQNRSRESLKQSKDVVHKSDERGKRRSTKETKSTERTEDMLPVVLEEKRSNYMSQNKTTDTPKRGRKQKASREKHVAATKSRSDQRQEPARKIVFTKGTKQSIRTTQEIDPVKREATNTRSPGPQKEENMPSGEENIRMETPGHRDRRRLTLNTSEGINSEKDGEMTPFLSPIAKYIPNHTPQAPRKSIAKLQRTRLGKFA